MKITNIYEEEHEVEVGDLVGFKSDFEQYGRVIKLFGDYAIIENENGFGGEYIGGQTQTQVSTDRLWKDPA